MLSDYLVHVTAFNITAGLLALGLLTQIVVRVNYAYKFSKARGVSCGKLANDPFTALLWLWGIGWAQAQNKMIDFFNMALLKASPECPGIAEINITGGQRYLFTEEPEHIKTLLTGRFADFGKGDEFHRVWVCGLPLSVLRAPN